MANFLDFEASPSCRSHCGTLTGIGVGPGDPDLITLKALTYLEQAAVVAYPRGREGKPGLAQKIIADRLAPHQQQLPLDFPYVFEAETLENAWQEAAEQVWQVLSQGQDVVFACEGDLSFYGTFTYLAQALAAHHPDLMIRRVPGVCSPMAAVSALGLPLTLQSEKLVILPALYSLADLDQALNWAEVIVLLKVNSVYPQVWALLQRRQLLQRSWVVVRASQPDQEIYDDLSRYPALQLPYFSLMVIRCP
ncbi:MAG: precorrin-2 C(20)-methyltransferase [Cyanobacteriota bacterium]|jgi:precorrin-2/cobalt-factor-2 C20-methyltransferase|nr:precorrin-2 C(20)-methyltransferase [Cyanobacteriota bacterium]